MNDFTMTKDGEGIATITWDTVGKSMNVMTLEAWGDLEALVDDDAADPPRRGFRQLGGVGRGNKQLGQVHPGGTITIGSFRVYKCRANRGKGVKQ